MRVIRTNDGLLGGLAFCKNCIWSEENYTTALKEARKHCKSTGHEVEVEITELIRFKKKD